MELVLNLTTTKGIFPSNYRELFLEFISNTINTTNSLTKHYDFTFSVEMAIQSIKKGYVKLRNNRIKLKISTTDSVLFSQIQNGAIGLKKKVFQFEKVEFKLNSLYVAEVQEVKLDQVFIRFTSPLIVSGGDETYKWGHNNLSKELLRLTQLQLREKMNNTPKLDLRLVPFRPLNTTVILKNKSQNAITGDFVLESSPEVINYLRLSGMGSERSSGFGKFEILNGFKI